MKWLARLDRELPPWLQLALFLPLQAAWVLAVVLVEAKARANAQGRVYFANQRLVYTLILLWLPLALSVTGYLFLVRQRRAEDWTRGRRIVYWAFAGLTLADALTCLCGGGWALLLPGESGVRE